jgi:hypothetical protein
MEENFYNRFVTLKSRTNQQGWILLECVWCHLDQALLNDALLNLPTIVVDTDQDSMIHQAVKCMYNNRNALVLSANWSDVKAQVAVYKLFMSRNLIRELVHNWLKAHAKLIDPVWTYDNMPSLESHHFLFSQPESRTVRHTLPLPQVLDLEPHHLSHPLFDVTIYRCVRSENDTCCSSIEEDYYLHAIQLDVKRKQVGIDVPDPTPTHDPASSSDQKQGDKNTEADDRYSISIRDLKLDNPVPVETRQQLDTWANEWIKANHTPNWYPENCRKPPTPKIGEQPTRSSWWGLDGDLPYPLAASGTLVIKQVQPAGRRPKEEILDLLIDKPDSLVLL